MAKNNFLIILEDLFQFPRANDNVMTLILIYNWPIAYNFFLKKVG